MKNTAFVIVTVIAAVILAWVIWLVVPSEGYRVYDCSLSEFHPDFPPAVREECRRLRINSTTLTT
jgi:hypothetical protein